MSPYKLPSDAVWFITGCSSGIGLSVAALLSKTPNRVVATARKVSALSYLPDAPNILKLSLDVTSTENIQSAISAVLAKFGRIDVLVNNAGYGLYGDTESSTDEQARQQMDTNFFGVVDTTKEALRVMREENPKTGQIGGVICQISSMGGRQGFPGGAFYHASKFAVEGFTEALAKEMHPDWNINFTIIEPGGVKTEYVGTSMVHIAQHPAYTDPGCPTNQLRAYLLNPVASANFASPDKVAQAIYGSISKGVDGCNGGKGGIPLRLPLGADTWGMLKAQLEAEIEELDVLRPVSVSVSGEEQLASIDFLRNK